MTPRVVVITGATAGIGLAAAELFASKGDIVYGIARHEPVDPAKGVRYMVGDVSVEASVVHAVDAILAEAGRIDVLINNAGFGIAGAVEFTGTAEAKAQFDVNFFGTFNCIRTVLPHMRERGGSIINVGSVAGVTPIPYQAFYSASKAAIHSLTRALANEVSGFDIRVSALMPGDVKTGFTASRRKAMKGSDVYANMERSVARMERDEQHGMEPAVLARALYRISVCRRPKTLYSCGIVYKAICVLARLLPMRLVDLVLNKMYN